MAICTVSIIAVQAQVLTLNEAIRTALRNSLQVEVARNNFEANVINNHPSVAGSLPVVTGSLTDNQALTNLNQRLSNGTNTKRSGNATNALNSSITASILVYNGNRVHAIKGRLGALENLSEQQIYSQIQNLTADVMVKYYDIVRQQGYMKTIAQTLEVIRQQVDIIDARQQVGLANNADRFQAQLDLNAAKQEFAAQELVLRQSKTDLLNLLTLPPDSNFVIKDTIVVDSTIVFQHVLDSLTQHPDLLSAAAQIRANEYLVREVRAQRYPAVSVNTGYSYNRNQNAAGFTLLNQTRGPFVGVALQVPIFNGGLFRRQERVAELDIKNATLTQENLLNNMRAAAVRAWQGYTGNLQQLRNEQENSRIAEALLNLTLKRLELSAATILEVREAQQSFVAAGYRLMNLAYAAKVAEIELKRLANNLDI